MPLIVGVGTVITTQCAPAQIVTSSPNVASAGDPSSAYTQAPAFVGTIGRAAALFRRQVIAPASTQLRRMSSALISPQTVTPMCGEDGAGERVGVAVGRLPGVAVGSTGGRVGVGHAAVGVRVGVARGVRVGVEVGNPI